MVRLLPPFAFAVALVAFAGPAAADDKAEKKATLTGVWAREAGGLDLKFDFTDAKKGTFKLTAVGGENGVVLTCKHTVMNGVVKAEVTAVDEKGTFPNKPPVGFEFGFKWAAKGDAAELSELTGENIDNVRPVVEGEYKRVKGTAKKD
jgi:hypothetical protein